MTEMLTDRRQTVWDKTGGLCAYCGMSLMSDDAVRRNDGRVPSGTSRMVVDHVVPRARGGKDAIGNLAPACSDCNCIKGSRSVEWLAARLANGR